MIAGIDDLIAYLRVFHRSWEYKPGLDANYIPLDLPRGLASLYRELGGLIALEGERTPFGAQDGLVPLDRLKRINGMIEFAWENQGNWSCRCPIGTSDPPVYSNAADVWNKEQRGFQKVCESLEHFLVTLCLQEAVMSAPVLATVGGDSFEGVLTRPPEPLWLGGWYVNGEPDHNFYVVSERDLLLMEYAGLWAASHDVNALSVFRNPKQFNRLY